MTNRRKCTFEPINKGDSKLKDLRWTTLGYHHNWDSKKYDEKKTGTVPDILNDLAELIQKLTKNDSFKAEASLLERKPSGSAIPQVTKVSPNERTRITSG